MNIDWSIHSVEHWKDLFERYITGGGNLSHLTEDTKIEYHFNQSLPEEMYTIQKKEISGGNWDIEGTHPKCGPFRISGNKANWVFEWMA